MSRVSRDQAHSHGSNWEVFWTHSDESGVLNPSALAPVLRNPRLVVSDDPVGRWIDGGSMASQAGFMVDTARLHPQASQQLCSAFDGDGDGCANWFDFHLILETLRADTRRNEKGFHQRRTKLDRIVQGVSVGIQTRDLLRKTPPSCLVGLSIVVDSVTSNPANETNISIGPARITGLHTERMGMFKKKNYYDVRSEVDGSLHRISLDPSDGVHWRAIGLDGGQIAEAAKDNLAPIARRNPWANTAEFTGPLVLAAQVSSFGRFCSAEKDGCMRPCGPIPACLVCFWIHGCMIGAPCTALCMAPCNEMSAGKAHTLELREPGVYYSVEQHTIYSPSFVMCEQEEVQPWATFVPLEHIESISAEDLDKGCPCCIQPPTLIVTAYGVQVAALDGVANAHEIVRAWTELSSSAGEARRDPQAGLNSLPPNVKRSGESWISASWIALERARHGLGLSPFGTLPPSAGIVDATEVVPQGEIVYAAATIVGSATTHHANSSGKRVADVDDRRDQLVTSRNVVAPSAPPMQRADDVREILGELGLLSYLSTFEKQGVDHRIFFMLDDDTLRTELGVASRIHRLKILNYIKDNKP